VRTRAGRAAIAVATVAAAIALFFAFADDESGADPATTQPQEAQVTTDDESPASTTATQPQSTPETTEAEPASPPPPRFERIVVRDGKPVGGIKRLEYERGDQVRFLVRTDAADEVHVHGFDITKDVPANRSVRFRLTADLEGVFEVELHHAHAAIAELRIGP
jgi:hypothetical protein